MAVNITPKTKQETVSTVVDVSVDIVKITKFTVNLKRSFIEIEWEEGYYSDAPTNLVFVPVEHGSYMFSGQEMLNVLEAVTADGGQVGPETERIGVEALQNVGMI